MKLSNILCTKCDDFFDLMIKGLKIIFRYDAESTEIYDSLLDNGTWVGIVGLVHRQVKFCSCPRWWNEGDVKFLSRPVVKMHFPSTANKLNVMQWRIYTVTF